MSKLISSTLLMAGLCLVFLLSGCVERKEKILIHKNGAVAIFSAFVANSSQELYEGRVPSEKQGWTVRASTKTDSEGKVQHLLAAWQKFQPSDLPSTYACPDLKDASSYLRFPTSVRFEKREDGTYCHFRRVYKKRQWAHIASLKDSLFKGNLKALLDKDPKELSQSERIEFIGGMARLELHKMLTFARAAFLKVTPDENLQDGWLLLFNDVLALQKSLDLDRLATLIGRTARDGDLELTHVAEKFESDVRDTILSGLRTYCGYTKTQEAAFLDENGTQEHCYDLSEDVENEKFSISLEMPGEVVAANTDKIDGNTASWEFEGNALLDCDYEIIISSRIAN
jgi:hypothetical protein